MSIKNHFRAKEIADKSEKESDELSAKIQAKRKMTATEKNRLDSLGNRASGKAGKRYLTGMREENMEPISTGIKALQEKNLEEMRSNFNEALARKALQEKKLEIASSYFGK